MDVWNYVYRAVGYYVCHDRKLQKVDDTKAAAYAHVQPD